MSSLCIHPVGGVTTTLYEVLCGIPLPDPTDSVEVQRRYQDAHEPYRFFPSMMRAWCQVCGCWQEPLLDATATQEMEG